MDDGAVTALRVVVLALMILISWSWATATARPAKPRWQTLPAPPPMPKADAEGSVEVTGARIFYAVYGKGDPVWANWHGGSAWLSQHLWEHYAFGGDVNYLRQRAYPVMKAACELTSSSTTTTANPTSPP